MDLIQLTRELGKAIQQDERYLRLQAAKQASDEDSHLQRADWRIQPEENGN